MTHGARQPNPMNHNALPSLNEPAPLTHDSDSTHETLRSTKLATAIRNGFDPDADVEAEPTVESYDAAPQQEAA